MANGENLIQVSKDSGIHGMINHSLTPFAYRFVNHPIITPLIERSSKNVWEDAPNTLKYGNLETAVIDILSQEKNIQATVDSLFPDKNARLQSVDILPIQMGRKAYIVLCQAKTSEGKGHFALYVGRNANGSTMGNEAEKDYHNLRDLSDAADRRLTEKAKKKYRFLKPYALFEPISSSGHDYSSFSMPFIDDYGELRVDVFEDLPNAVRFPYFRYSIPFSKKMKEVGEVISKRNEALVKKARQIRQRYYGHPDEMDKAYQRMPEVKMMTKQTEELLIGNALIYLLSEGHFPKDFYVNAGDWMVNFINDSLFLYLITIRGGWEYMGSDETWKKKMLEHSEQIPGREMESVAIPIFYNQGQLIENALSKARQLLKE